MMPADRWGPFAADLDPAERPARLRCLRALARFIAGPRSADLCRLLAQAEADVTALAPALMALDRLPSLDRRQIPAAYAATHRSDHAA